MAGDFDLFLDSWVVGFFTMALLDSLVGSLSGFDFLLHIASTFEDACDLLFLFSTRCHSLLPWIEVGSLRSSWQAGVLLVLGVSTVVTFSWGLSMLAMSEAEYKPPQIGSALR